MYSWILFIPLTVCLLGVIGGGMLAVLAAVGLLRTGLASFTTSEAARVPPVLPGQETGAAAGKSTWRILFKLLLVVGLAMGVAGGLGIWVLGFSIHYVPNPAVEWSEGHAPELEALIRKHCVSFLNRGQGVAMALAVVTPTNSTLMTFGWPRLTSHTQTGPDTLFEIGSITKTFTGLTLARALERGDVRLDQPIQELLPPGVAFPPVVRGITLRQLTTHSSGLPRVAKSGLSLNVVGMLLCGSDPYAGYDRKHLLADLQTVELESEPGTKGGYSNIGMMLLGDLLARKAGTNYEGLVRQEVCEPLGMHDTMVNPDAAQARRTAQAYRAAVRLGPFVLASTSAPWFLGSELGGAGGLRSSGADMLKYLRANLHPETQPIAGALRESHKELFKENERISFGMNWIRSRGGKNRPATIWHNGATGGFCSFLGFTTDGRFGVLVLSNTSADVDPIGVGILRELAKPKP